MVVEVKVFSDILSFLKTLNFVDIVFFFAVLILMILIVTLIYFITINNEEKSDEKEETAEMKIIKESSGFASVNVAIKFGF